MRINCELNVVYFVLFSSYKPLMTGLYPSSKAYKTLLNDRFFSDIHGSMKNLLHHSKPRNVKNKTKHMLHLSMNEDYRSKQPPGSSLSIHMQHSQDLKEADSSVNNVMS